MRGLDALGIGYVPSHGNFLLVRIGGAAAIYDRLLRQGRDRETGGELRSARAPARHGRLLEDENRALPLRAAIGASVAAPDRAADARARTRSPSWSSSASG